MDAASDIDEEEPVCSSVAFVCLDGHMLATIYTKSYLKVPIYDLNIFSLSRVR